jgi:hypothetical protein
MRTANIERRGGTAGLAEEHDGFAANVRPKGGSLDRVIPSHGVPGVAQKHDPFLSGRPTRGGGKEIQTDRSQLRRREFALVALVRPQPGFARRVQKYRQLHQVLIGITVRPVVGHSRREPASQTGRRRAPSGADDGPGSLPVHRREFPRPVERMHRSIFLIGCPGHSVPVAGKGDCDRGKNARAANRECRTPVPPGHWLAGRDD